MKKDAGMKIGMMDENSYWELVEASLEYANDENKQLNFLVTNLKERTPEEIVGFMLRTHQLQRDVYTPQMWCAGFLMNKGYCSDDGFEYFRSWVISRGKETYYKAKDNPDSLVSKLNSRIQFYDYETFGYTGSYAYEQKTGGKNIYADLGDHFSFPKRPTIKFNWSAGQPDTMKAICPRLFEKMWSENVYNTTMNLLRQLRPKKKKKGGGKSL